MPDVFLSYSREDQAIARRFADALHRAGFEVWWDQALTAGEAFDRVTEKALDEAKAVVVLWSRNSVDSNWVRAEATQGHASNRLVPVMIEPCRRPILFELTQTADLGHWQGDDSDPAWLGFIAGLRRFIGRAPSGASAAPVTPVAGPRRWLAWTSAALAAALIGAGALWFFAGRGAGTATTTREASIAVLPFRDMSPSRDQEYFADGVTEEILNSLAELRDLKVTARTSAFSFKGKDVDLRTVGRALGVRHILEGSIRKDGEKLRITAQLIDAQTDAHLWSKTYDRPFVDVFAVQEDIARSVAEQLQVTLGVGFGRDPGMTHDARAYDAFLAGVAARLEMTSESQKRAIEFAQRALQLDPSFVAAWELLGATLDGLPAASGIAAPADTAQKADEAYRRVAELMPQSPGLEGRLAEQALARGQWKEAGEHYRKMAADAARFTRNPANELSVVTFSLLTGRPRQAIQSLEALKAIDPLNNSAALFLAAAYGEVGDFAAARAESERGDALAGVGWNLVRNGAVINALAAGDLPQVQRWLQAVIEIQTEASLKEFNRRLMSLVDKPAEGVAFLHAARAELPPFAHASTANWLGYFNDVEGALENLRHAAEHGAIGTVALEIWRPTMANVRKAPGFEKLLHDIGMADYLAESGGNEFCTTTGGRIECR